MNLERRPHCARFSPAILDELARQLRPFGLPWVLDCFAGTGRLAQIKERGFTEDVVCLELEPEWAVQALDFGGIPLVADATRMPFADASVPGAGSSPSYGNRMGDRGVHQILAGPKKRHTYTSNIGRHLHPNNTGGYRWGPRYWLLTIGGWLELARVLEDGAPFSLNVSDFLRTVGPRGARVEERVEVEDFHHTVLTLVGFNRVERVERVEVETQRQRHGQNSEKRVDSEVVSLYIRRPRAPGEDGPEPTEQEEQHGG